MSFNVHMSGSTLGFDFIAAAATGEPMIADATSIFWDDSTSSINFIDTVFGVVWQMTGTGLGPNTTSLASIIDAPLAQITGVLTVSSGRVVAQIGGKVKAADGSSDYLTLDFMMTNDWGDFYGLGRDTVRLTNQDDTLPGLAGRDNVYGLGGDDTILGGAAGDILRGGTGGDTLGGGAGNDRLLGQGGGDSLTGDAGRDRLLGQNGGDTLAGGGGNDFLDGGKGADILIGGAGRDTLRGGGGSDELTMDGGSDTVYGGAGADDFVYATGTARIFDFKDNVDEILLAGRTGDINAIIDTATEGSGNVRIDFGDGDLLIVHGISDRDLLRDDMAFV